MAIFMKYFNYALKKIDWFAFDSFQTYDSLYLIYDSSNLQKITSLAVILTSKRVVGLPLSVSQLKAFVELSLLVLQNELSCNGKGDLM